MMDYLALSKIVSLALRHRPDKYAIILDADGWGDINVLIESIKNLHIEFADIMYEDLVVAININGKKRHETKSHKIRALYGHTLDIKIQRESTLPPKFLYHGTTNNNLKQIKLEGLQKMNRQYVHLSETFKQAEQVALRKTTHPIILKINALGATNNGMLFYKEKDIWLCDYIDVKFIDLQN